MNHEYGLDSRQRSDNCDAVYSILRCATAYVSYHGSADLGPKELLWHTAGIGTGH
jgi:hypothetical protein